MTWIKTIRLSNFRNYGAADIDALPCGPVVFYGPNGAGKTNVLEAVSLLSPGRGLRGAKAMEMQRISNEMYLSRRSVREGGWVISADTETPYGPTRIGTGLDTETDKRIVRINGDAKSQSALSDYLSCVWLTPQMDRLFLDGASTRRRFFDRLVFAFDAGHSGRTTRFDNAMTQRSKILRDHDRPDPAWLNGLEVTMAETGIAIAVARLELARTLQQACDAAEGELFPRAQLRMIGTLEELLDRAPALEVEDLYKFQLRESRMADAATGGAATGPHKSDLSVMYAAKSMPAAQCSTGEQKALLIGMILAHSRLIMAERGAPPILLLDEVAAHLDENRRAGLYDLLLTMGGQVWMTGTDKDLFAALGGNGLVFKVDGATITPSPQRGEGRVRGSGTG